MKKILVILACLTIGSKVFSQATNFSYVLTRKCKTSAGVYNSSSQLIRTIWASKPDSAGTRIGWWDGNDDFGSSATGGPFTIQALDDSVVYHWDGIIGNSSTNQTGPTTLGGNFADPGTENMMLAVGSVLYISTGYGEGTASRMRTTTSNYNSIVAYIGGKNGFTNELIASDGTNVYWSFYNGSTSNSAVYATTVASDANVSFSSGTTYSGWSTLAYSNGGAAPTYEIRGLAVQLSHPYIVVCRPGINQVLVCNKTTGALAQTYTITGAGPASIDGSDDVG
jgi:hypothetical protein